MGQSFDLDNRNLLGDGNRNTARCKMSGWYRFSSVKDLNSIVYHLLDMLASHHISDPVS